MPFAQLAGQEDIVRTLRSALRERRLSHAYLFSGPAGTGKGLAAHLLSQAVFCERIADDACGECPSCRRIEAGNHPDVVWVEPDGKSVKLAQIEQLRRTMSHQAVAGGRKMYMIRHADSLTEEAANSLLKMLEEPDFPVTAILLAENGQAVIPTLRSRCQELKFAALPPQRMIALLEGEGVNPVLARAAAHLCGGVQTAREMCETAEFAEARKVVIRLMQECLTGISAAVVTVQAHVVRTGLIERIDWILGLIALYLRDLIQAQAGHAARLVFADQTDALAKQCHLCDSGTWVRALGWIAEALKRLEANVQPQIVLEQLLIRIYNTVNHRHVAG